MKTFKKILITMCVIIIAIGMFVLGKQGLNYTEEYSKSRLIATITEFVKFMIIATTVIIVYLAIRYNRQGVLKIIITSILGIVGAMVFVVAVVAIIKMPITRLFFSIILGTYVSSLIVLSSSFEANT